MKTPKTYKNKLPILLDMDSIIVEMTPTWLDEYYKLTGELIKEEQLTSWKFDEFVKDKEKLDSILARDGFFYNLPPMPGAHEYLTKLIDEDYNIIILTQPSRKGDMVVRDKRNWIKKFFPRLDTLNLIFAHKKEYVRGMLLFDDNNHHLESWKILNPGGITVAIDYPYNKNCKMNIRLTKETAWKDFYKIINSYM